jgi:hypothetical protein
MVRLLLAAFAASVTFSVTGYAADPQMIVAADRNPKITHAKIVDAAKKVCQSAIKYDPFGDFGSLGECVENSVHSARPVASGAETLAQRGG